MFVNTLFSREKLSRLNKKGGSATILADPPKQTPTTDGMNSYLFGLKVFSLPYLRLISFSQTRIIANGML